MPLRARILSGPIYSHHLVPTQRVPLAPDLRPRLPPQQVSASAVPGRHGQTRWSFPTGISSGGVGRAPRAVRCAATQVYGLLGGGVTSGLAEPAYLGFEGQRVWH